MPPLPPSLLPPRPRIELDERLPLRPPPPIMLRARPIGHPSSHHPSPPHGPSRPRRYSATCPPVAASPSPPPSAPLHLWPSTWLPRRFDYHLSLRRPHPPLCRRRHRTRSATRRGVDGPTPRAVTAAKEPLAVPVPLPLGRHDCGSAYAATSTAVAAPTPGPLTLPQRSLGHPPLRRGTPPS